MQALSRKLARCMEELVYDKELSLKLGRGVYR
jgi:hypothetical protein